MDEAESDGLLLATMAAAGVGLVVDVVPDALPAVLHWGGDLGPLTADDASALRTAAVVVPGTNLPDEPPRVAVLPEPSTGWAGRPGLVGSRDGAAWATRFAVREVRLDGRPVAGHVASGPGLLTVAAGDDEIGLGLVIAIELLASGLVRCRATVVDEGDGGYRVDAVTPALPVPPTASELLDFAGRHERERVEQRRAFTVGLHLRENRKGRTGADSAFVLHAAAPGTGFADGEVWAVHTAWSGNHTHHAEHTATGHRLLGGGELLLPGEVRLGAGEAYTSPWLYGAYGRGLDAVARRFHRHQRARPRAVTRPRPVTLNVWEAVWFDHDLPRLLALAERAAGVGVERFVLDDGWFGARRDDRAGLGDWVPSPEVWPDGLHPLVDRVRALGMEFGLWVEPEMVNPDSDLARAHPEWLLAARRDRPVEVRHQQVLDLAHPGAYAHVRDRLLALLAEYDVAALKWDHNRDLVEAGDPARSGRPAVHAQTAAVYRLLDDLRDAHPALEIESCSSGGARIDLGVLERTDRVWVSDDIDPHERQSMQRWTTQLVPPEYLGAHVGSGRAHGTRRRHDLGFRAATAVFGHLGVEWDLAAATPEELAELAAWIAFHRAERALLHRGDLVRMDTAHDDLVVHGVVAPDRSRALVAYVVLGALPWSTAPPLRFRGLEPAARYRVAPVTAVPPPAGIRAPGWWADGVELTGAVIGSVGLAAPWLPPDQAVLLTVDRVTPGPP